MEKDRTRKAYTTAEKTIAKFYLITPKEKWYSCKKPTYKQLAAFLGRPEGSMKDLISQAMIEFLADEYMKVVDD